MRFFMFLYGLTVIAALELDAADSPSPVYIGSAGCSAFGCHGNGEESASTGWKSSFVRWSSSDPHQRGFEVLASPRSQRMIQRLSDAEQPVTGTPYWTMVEQRCLGCHATPPPGNRLDPGVPPVGEQLSALNRGVTCESCHGAADTWLQEHVTDRWRHVPPADQWTQWGMIDTKSLTGRATLCASCHVGPKQLTRTGRKFDVDHDLIAAGHPRLAFEFSTYLANLPVHWNAAEDRERNGQVEFAARAWRIGQFVAAGQLAAQLDARADNAMQRPPGRLDLANYECFDCHHRIQVPRFERPNRIAQEGVARGSPRLADGPFRLLRAIADPAAFADLDGMLNTASQRMAASGQPIDPGDRAYWRDLTSQFAALCRPDILEKPQPLEARRESVQRLVAHVSTASQPAWDDLVHVQLAVANHSHCDDVDAESRTALRRCAEQLANYLNRQFTVPAPSLYDSPERFDPTGAEVTSLLRDVEQSLNATPASAGILRPRLP